MLAQKTEKHELLEFRRIAAYLFKKNGRYDKSIELSTGDKLYTDAIDTASQSNSPELVDVRALSLSLSILFFPCC